MVQISFFFVFSFIFISWRLIILQYCSGFLSYIDMNQPWIYMCSPLPPPSPSHPSGSSQCTSSEHLSHASTLGWRSVSHLIVYLFQCYSLRTWFKFLSHTREKPCPILLQGQKNCLSWRSGAIRLIYCSFCGMSKCLWTQETRACKLNFIKNQ